MTTMQYALPNGIQAFGLSQADSEIVYEEIFVNDCYFQEGIRLRDGDTIFDVGANTGMFALRLNEGYRDLRVFSFEPIPAIHRALQKNAEQCKNISVTTEAVGLSCEPGEATFTFFPTVSCTSTMFPISSEEERRRARAFIIGKFAQQPWYVRYWTMLLPDAAKQFVAEVIRQMFDRRQELVCPLTTISEVIARRNIQRIDLLKIDTERAEQDILAGIEESDWPKIQQVVMEVHDGEGPLAAVKSLLLEQGFAVKVQEDPELPYNFMLYARRN